MQPDFHYGFSATVKLPVEYRSLPSPFRGQLYCRGSDAALLWECGATEPRARAEPDLGRGELLFPNPFLHLTQYFSATLAFNAPTFH